MPATRATLPVSPRRKGVTVTKCDRKMLAIIFFFVALAHIFLGLQSTMRIQSKLFMAHHDDDQDKILPIDDVWRVQGTSDLGSNRIPTSSRLRQQYRDVRNETSKVRSPLSVAIIGCGPAGMFILHHLAELRRKLVTELEELQARRANGLEDNDDKIREIQITGDDPNEPPVDKS